MKTRLNKKWVVSSGIKAFNYRKGGILSLDISRLNTSGGSKHNNKKPETRENMQDLNAIFNGTKDLFNTRARLRLDSPPLLWFRWSTIIKF